MKRRAKQVAVGVGLATALTVVTEDPHQRERHHLGRAAAATI